MIWQQSLKGRVIDLVNPAPAQVDFEEIAMTLARINRYGGASETPVSVALHTLIALSACEIEAAKPYVLLHDAHEAYIGDITSPMAQALRAVANEFVENEGWIAKAAIGLIKHRHDLAIWARAGLPPPRDEIRKEIRRADLVALQTERRDFLAPTPKPWAPYVESKRPMAESKRMLANSPAWTATELVFNFKEYLPAAAFLPYSAP